MPSSGRFNFKFLDRHEMGLEACRRTATGSGSGSRRPGEEGPLHALPRRRRDGLRVHPREPARGRPDHVPLVPRAAEAITAAGGARLAARARARGYGTPEQSHGPVRLALQRCEGLGQVPGFIAKSRPDEEEARRSSDVLTNDLVRSCQRARPTSARARRDAAGVQADTRPSRTTTVPKPASSCSRSNGRGAPRRRGASAPDRRRRWRTHLRGTRTRTTPTPTTRRCRDRGGRLPLRRAVGRARLDGARRPRHATGRDPSEARGLRARGGEPLRRTPT